MPRNNSGPPCPKPERVRELIETINNEEVVQFYANIDCLDLTDSLDWLATMLENRTLYHKKQQVKNKVLRQLAHEYGIDDQANVMTNEAMHTFVSNQAPDKQDIIDMSELSKLQQGDNNDEK